MLVFTLNEDCNAMTFSCLIGKTPVDILVIQIKLLFLRTNCTITEEDSMCYHHEKFYLSLFQNLQQYCSDPWKQHSKQIKSIYESLISKLLKN